jgi:hypothetical protein
MWGLFGKLLAYSKTLNALLGDVIFITPQERGASARSFFEWRVKKSIDDAHVDDAHVYVAVRMMGTQDLKALPQITSVSTLRQQFGCVTT